MAGNALRNGEGPRAPEHDHASAPQSNGHRETTAVEPPPVTKIPPLDTVDRYAVEAPLRDAPQFSPSIDLSCALDPLDVVDDILQGYARFISRFTALDDLAFVVSRSGDFSSGSESRRGLARAVFSKAESDEGSSVQSPSPCELRELGHTHYNNDEIQFALELGSASRPENGQQNQISQTDGEVSPFETKKKSKFPINKHLVIRFARSVWHDRAHAADLSLLPQRIDPGCRAWTDIEDDCLISTRFVRESQRDRSL